MIKIFKRLSFILSLILLLFIGWEIIKVENEKKQVTLEYSEDIEGRETLIIGDDINYPPYSYLDENGQPQGFNLELAKEVANVMGYNVKFKLDSWNNVRNDLERGNIDFVSGMFRSQEREDIYGFTTRHSIATGEIFTRQEDKVEKITDLTGKKVVVQEGDIIYEYLKEQNLEIDFVKVPTVYEALNLVSQGKYDQAAVLRIPGHYIIKKEGIYNLIAQSINIELKDYCMAVSKENEKLLLTLNSGLYILKSTGKYQEIYNKWFGIYEKKTTLEVLKDNLLFIFIVLLIFITLVVWNGTLQKMVSIKTMELQKSNKELTRSKERLRESNQELEASMEQLCAVEEELRRQYDQLLENEEKLRKSEEHNKAIINALPDTIYVVSNEGRILDCQVSDENNLDMPQKFFIGAELEDIFTVNVAIEVKDRIKKTLDNNTLETLRYESKDSYYEMRIIKSKPNEVIAINRNITKEKKAQLINEYLSYHDQLTGLYNRRHFEEELLRLDMEENLPFTVVMADVNGLKLINDSFGHSLGDKLLQKAGEILVNGSRKGEIICRIGGDEFVILLPRTSEEEAENIIKNINNMCDNEKVDTINLSISFGVMSKLSIDEDIYEVLKKAEDKMYKKKLFEGPSMRGRTIGAIINTLHEKNNREEEHSRRVSHYCTKFAKVLGFSETDTQEMKTVGLLHDIGKIAIDEYLLNKAGKLTDEEMKEVQKHAEIGYRILSSVNDMSEMAEYVLSHHERWDGKGYPKGISKEEIPVQARIIAIADAYDAMTSERSYRKAMPKEKAIYEIKKNSGTQFDPSLTEIFLNKVI